MATDESNLGIVFGLICVVLALTPWIFFDWWLHKHHHEYITTEFREALQAPGWWGLIMMFFIGGVLAVALWHFFYLRSIQ